MATVKNSNGSPANSRLSTVAMIALMIGTTGLVFAQQAPPQQNGGAGTPCTSCSIRCYQWSISHWAANGGCMGLSNIPGPWIPNDPMNPEAGGTQEPSPLTKCLAEKCAPTGPWCQGCVDIAKNYIDCSHKNCRFVDTSICDNACFGIGCAQGKTCRNEQVPCDGDIGEGGTLACTQCGCVN
jgi:hypothetical protein